MFAVPYRKDPSPTFYQGIGFRLVPSVLWLFFLGVLAAGRLQPRK
jgi:hypothetical protein